jgi:short-subunit dehydrogenase
MKDCHVVITGASSGIGAALARELSTAGAKITLVARRKERLDELAQELAGPACVLPRDLSQSDTSWLEEARKHLGPIDVLVNNAGMHVLGPFHQIDLDQADIALQINLHTPLRLIRAVLPEMLSSGGTIVNVTSLAALAPPAGMTWYNASKAGLAAASESLRSELRGSKVRVLTVYPGIIDDTPMGTEGIDAYEPSWALRLQSRTTAQRLSRQIHRSLCRGHARLVYPRSGNFTRWFPGTTRWAMDRFTPLIRS